MGRGETTSSPFKSIFTKSSEKHCGDGLNSLFNDYSINVKRISISTFDLRYLEEIE